jgi:hypothetical protein
MRTLAINGIGCYRRFYGTSRPAKVHRALNEIIIENKNPKKEGMQLPDGLEIFRFVYGFSWPRARREEKVVAISFLTLFPRSNILLAERQCERNAECKLLLSTLAFCHNLNCKVTWN